MFAYFHIRDIILKKMLRWRKTCVWKTGKCDCGSLQEIFCYFQTPLDRNKVLKYFIWQLLWLKTKVVETLVYPKIFKTIPFFFFYRLKSAWGPLASSRCQTEYTKNILTETQCLMLGFSSALIILDAKWYSDWR